LDIAKGFAALHVAAKEGVVPAVEGLLSRGVSVSEKAKYGETALHLAASNGHLRALKLLASKSPIHVLNAKDYNGWTAAHRAVTSGNDELVLWRNSLLQPQPSPTMDPAFDLLQRTLNLHDSPTVHLRLNGNIFEQPG
jgi:ankyrin repeat protein